MYPGIIKPLFLCNFECYLFIIPKQEKKLSADPEIFGKIKKNLPVSYEIGSQATIEFLKMLCYTPNYLFTKRGGLY